MRTTQARMKLFAVLVITTFLFVIPFQNCAKMNFSSPTTVNLASTYSCVAPDAPTLEPKSKYNWHIESQSNSPGARYNQVMAAPIVGDLDGDGIPEIIFVSFSGDNDNSYGLSGALRILNGVDGSLKASIMDSSIAPIGYTTPLLIDLQGNGTRQLVYSTGTTIVALNSDLTVRWTIPLPSSIEGFGCMGGFAAADLDGNGKAEVIADRFVVEENSSRVPSIRFSMAKGASCTTYAASLDPSHPNKMQVVGGDGVYDSTGKKIFSYEVGTTDFSGGFLASGDVDKSRPGVEIAITKNGSTALFDGLTGKMVWQTSVDPGSTCSGSVGQGGPPNIGDFLGNGSLEIGVATGKYYSVYDKSGKLVWHYGSRDCSSAITGATLFDFNGDGKPEVIYGDENYLRIFDAQSGKVLYSIPNPSATLMEYPVVADVDGDGHSELVVVTNNIFNSHSDFFAGVSDDEKAKINAVQPGIRVFSAASKSAWAPTRKLWNQYSYFVSNVSDDLKATSTTFSSALAGINSFRQNAFIDAKPICSN